jgi:DNA-binding NarL/FixJ family response regulator
VLTLYGLSGLFLSFFMAEASLFWSSRLNQTYQSELLSLHGAGGALPGAHAMDSVTGRWSSLSALPVDSTTGCALWVVANDWIVRAGLARVCETKLGEVVINTTDIASETWTVGVAATAGTTVKPILVLAGAQADLAAQAGRIVAATRFGRVALLPTEALPPAARTAFGDAAVLESWRSAPSVLMDWVSSQADQLRSTSPIDLRPGQSTRRASGPAGLLTPRQEEVLSLVARGLSNADIAGELSMSENTVRIHVSAILKALRLNNRTQAALWATQNLGNGTGMGNGNGAHAGNGHSASDTNGNGKRSPYA